MDQVLLHKFKLFMKLLVVLLTNGVVVEQDCAQAAGVVSGSFSSRFLSRPVFGRRPSGAD